jgi:cytochrome c-type biogenesis protein CcmE
MTDVQWEKSEVLANRSTAQRSGRWKFLIAGFLILAAVGYLIYYSTLAGARYYVTVDSLVNNPDMLGKRVRVGGAVVGDPIFDQETQQLTFVIANIPNDNDSVRKQGGLAAVLHKAVEDPTITRMNVVATNKEIPDLLKNEAQAILTGRLVQDGGQLIFQADQITLKCPTRYEEDLPEQAAP